jgi:hypothetical protein
VVRHVLEGLGGVVTERGCGRGDFQVFFEFQG